MLTETRLDSRDFMVIFVMIAATVFLVIMAVTNRRTMAGLALPHVCDADSKRSRDREISSQPPPDCDRRSRDHELLLCPPLEFELARP